jgi:hypothetical protein
MLSGKRAFDFSMRAGWRGISVTADLERGEYFLITCANQSPEC